MPANDLENTGLTHRRDLARYAILDLIFRTLRFVTLLMLLHSAPALAPSFVGLSQLPNARKFNLGKYPKGTLRQRFPAAGLGFDGRPPLSEQGFHLLSSLLEMCPVGDNAAVG